MSLFDTHCHFTSEESPEEFRRKCEEAGVGQALMCGGSYEDSLETAEFSKRAGNCLFAAGVHPNEAADFKGKAEDFEIFAEREGFAAVGEIGLDFLRGEPERGLQTRIFSEFLDLALKLGKPAVVHCRDKEGVYDAYAASYEHLKPFSEKGGSFVLHCYTGSVEWAERFLALGAYFGIGGIITFAKGQNVRDVALALPAKNLLLETDSPYLAPVPHRGKPNHPSLLPHTAKALAKLRGESLEALSEATTENAYKFLGIAKGSR